VSRHTRIVSIDRDNPDPEVLSEAAEILRNGGLVAFATETVYGLGADATNPAAVAKIFEAKGRPSFNPLIVHAADLEMVQTCVSNGPSFTGRTDDSSTVGLLARHFWPGPLTVVLPRSPIIPDIVTGGLETVGVRIPEPTIAYRLIASLGRPLAAPSANRSTGISPTLARHVKDDLDTRIDLILDSGQTTLGLESTVLDLTTREPRILRPGPISALMIEHVLGGLRVRDAEHGGESPTQRPLSPGQMAIHYAPKTKTVRLDRASQLQDFAWPKRAALVVFGEHAIPSIPEVITRIDLRTPEAAARDLYVVLHQCDNLGADLIVIMPPPDRAEWVAVRDRLGRAAQRWDGTVSKSQ
jgi:L-threonylcarbamoyladenylate synthase